MLCADLTSAWVSRPSAEHCVWRQVNIQAYLLWEQAGRPDGADFAGDARATLEAQLHAGTSVQDIEAALKAPEPKVGRHIVSAEFLLARAGTEPRQSGEQQSGGLAASSPGERGCRCGVGCSACCTPVPPHGTPKRRRSHSSGNARSHRRHRHLSSQLSPRLSRSSRRRHHHSSRRATSAWSGR